ncbi:hypothetical protein Angca_000421, partial [Angiostrongylus cantonensis]
QSSEQCCIADRTAGGWQRCHRRRSKRLTISLERIAMAKNLDLGVTDEDPHMGICLFHWRLIKYGKLDDLINDEEVKFHETGEFQYDKMGGGEMKYSIAAENHASSGHEDSDEEVDSAEEKAMLFNSISDWQDVETKDAKTFPVDDSDDEEDQRDSEDDEESFIKFYFGLCALSAASLRRYRKFFMIPTKASASKHAMLEGVENHFERLPVESTDAIMHFVYTARNRINTVE